MKKIEFAESHHFFSLTCEPVAYTNVDKWIGYPKFSLCSLFSYIFLGIISFE